MTAWTREDFAQAFDVSRETLQCFDAYAAELERWTRRINLVARSTLADVWGRHFCDSAQLWPLRPAAPRRWLDLGSGAGFPGLVVALLAREAVPELDVHLVESDQRKAVFLRTVAARCGVRVTVHDMRVEALPPMRADVVSARALAPLPDLLGHAEKHCRPGGIGLFPKGATRHNEIEASRAAWRFDLTVHPSRTDPAAGILEIGAITRV